MVYYAVCQQPEDCLSLRRQCSGPICLPTQAYRSTCTVSSTSSLAIQPAATASSVRKLRRNLIAHLILVERAISHRDICEHTTLSLDGNFSNQCPYTRRAFSGNARIREGAQMVRADACRPALLVLPAFHPRSLLLPTHARLLVAGASRPWAMEHCRQAMEHCRQERWPRHRRRHGCKTPCLETQANCPARGSSRAAEPGSRGGGGPARSGRRARRRARPAPCR